MSTTDDILKEMNIMAKSGYGTKDYDPKCKPNPGSKGQPFTRCSKNHGT